MADDSNGNLIIADGSVIKPPVGSRAVSVYHTPRNPTGKLSAPSTAIAIGTGDFHGFAWKKSTTVPGTDWTQVIP